MGFWHGVEYYELERVVGEEYYQQWSPVSSLFLLRGAQKKPASLCFPNIHSKSNACNFHLYQKQLFVRTVVVCPVLTIEEKNFSRLF